ncbi:hypothetical protein [Croceivirga thetidis]|uniref:HK97 gp10 family phage protein n=1 Tax=Croceivirga thetidis TaxID=2721623 RepID=A0ABX1GNJ6_9FLAO|nr:hypothetical protein [Croceivirga thetidis]NKI31464.1 hypothetical protein [Croceivirga thetidis]
MQKKTQLRKDLTLNELYQLRENLNSAINQAEELKKSGVPSIKGKRNRKLNITWEKIKSYYTFYSLGEKLYKPGMKSFRYVRDKYGEGFDATKEKWNIASERLIEIIESLAS